MSKFLNARVITILLVTAALTWLSLDVMESEKVCLDNGNSVAMCTGRG